MGSVCSEAPGEGLNSATLWEDCWVGRGWRAWPVVAELGWGCSLPWGIRSLTVTSVGVGARAP